MRFGRALAVSPLALTLALAVAAAVIALRKIRPEDLSEPAARATLAAAAAAVVATWLVSLLRRLPPSAGTVALDRHHGLADRLTSAVAFSALPDGERTPLMEVAIDDAAAHASALRPAKAVPIRVPRELAVSALACAGVAAVALLEVRPAPVEVVKLETIDAIPMSPDDLELFREAVKELRREDQSPEVQAAIERFNQLLEDIAQKRLDRTEAFRKLEAIERELLQGAEADAKALEDALRKTGEDLARSDLAKPVGEALAKNDLTQAEKELKQLAQSLRDGKKKPDKAAVDKLRRALEKAAARRKEALAAVNEKRAEAREDLLKKKQKRDPDAGAPDPEEERLLRKKERELERLDREAEQHERVGRQLDRLDRELAEAAENLLRDLGLSAEDLEQAAEDINRLQEEAMTDDEKERLRQRIEEMRELLRQQGQGGKERVARLMRFGKRARGGSGGEQREGQGQEGKEGQQGKDGDGQEGDGEGQDGRGQQLVLGPGGSQQVLVPGAGQGQGQAPEGQGQGQGQDPGGQGVGSGHDGDVAGQRTDAKMGTQDVEAQGLDAQEGPSNSEVILGAAERGFRGTAYKKVFTDYHTVAEEQIDKEQIPDGYRFYVRRYFQLIRPRE
jgi:hypothetical protein